MISRRCAANNSTFLIFAVLVVWCSHCRPYKMFSTVKYFLTIIIAKGRFAAASEIDPSYSPGGANVHPPSNQWFLGPGKLHSPSGISIGSADSVGCTIVTTDYRLTRTYHGTSTCIEMGHIYAMHAMQPKMTRIPARLTALCPGLPGWAGTRKVKPNWILLKQETVSGSGIRWAICKSAPCSRQITTPAPHHSVFCRPDALPAAQPTASKHWRYKAIMTQSVTNVHTVHHH